MSKKNAKETAKVIMQDVCTAPDAYKVKTKANYIGLHYNEKGQFYSAVFEIEMVAKHGLGEINFLRNVHLPLNLLNDVSVYEPADKAEEKKAE